MKIRSIKRAVYKRMRKVIPHTSGGVTLLANEIQMVRVYGNPNKPFQSAELEERRAGYHALIGGMDAEMDRYHAIGAMSDGNRVWVQRVVMEETDLSEVVGNDGKICAACIIPNGEVVQSQAADAEYLRADWHPSFPDVLHITNLRTGETWDEIVQVAYQPNPVPAS